jgi:hypothetical protein
MQTGRIVLKRTFHCYTVYNLYQLMSRRAGKSVVVLVPHGTLCQKVVLTTHRFLTGMIDFSPRRTVCSVFYDKK